ncbi:HAD family hydrolase [Paenibacillus hodogayensis]|uniref:HAD family hydrolase n=1 Tax=Paenibacillus hodogayensis TaxID=279208 RepID=A0ABV5W394_9BACL
MSSITTILFDFDGTLADTLPICIHAIGEAFRNHDGVDLTAAEVVAMFGPTEADIIRLNLRNRAAAEEGVELFYKLYREEHDLRVKPNADMIRLLDLLHARGYRMGIVTGKGRATLDISLERLGMQRYFGVTVSGDEMTRPKPDPEGVLTAMNALGSTTEETIFIGDSEADMRAGKGAGVFTVGAHWLEHVQTHRFETEPDLYVTNMDSLLAFLDKIG